MTQDKEKDETILWLSAELDRVGGNVEVTLDILLEVETVLSAFLSDKRTIISASDRVSLSILRDCARAIPIAIDESGTARDL